MNAERTGPAVITVRWPDVAAGWEQWILLCSDAHHDSPKCDRKLEKQHLDEMVARDGLWAEFGDLFDAMQGKYDPRRNYDEIRPEDQTEKYYDSIADHAAQFYAPYLDRCIMLGEGNHEAAASRNANISLLTMLVEKAKAYYGFDGDVLLGKYAGWLRLVFTVQNTKGQQLRIRYFHGSGDSAPVTKGVIQTNRQAVYLPDASVVLNGHNHNAYIVPLARDRLSERGKQYTDIQWHGRIPGYKNDYGDGTGGYAVEGGKPPTPKGALWLRLWCERDRVQYTLIPEIQ